MKKAVLFDFDGVLIDSEEISIDYDLAYFERHGLVFDRADYVNKVTGVLYNEYADIIRTAYRAQLGADVPPDFFENLRDIHQMVENVAAGEIAGARALLEDLSKAGVKIAIASNSGLERLARCTKRLDLQKYFNGHIYSAEQVAHGKPAPDVYLFAARKLGVDPRDCLVVEDSAPGTRAGVAAGAQVMGFSGGSHRDRYYMARLLDAGAYEVTDNMAVMRLRLRHYLGLDAQSAQRPKLGGPRPF